MVGNRRIRFVIVLDSCCISIGLVFIKDRPVSSFWVLRFRVLGVFVFEFWVLRFRSRVLRFRVLRFRNYQWSFARIVLYFSLPRLAAATKCVDLLFLLFQDGRQQNAEITKLKS